MREAADALGGRIGEVPSIGIVLGSGLGGFAESLHQSVSIGYEELPHWPALQVAGHDGRAVVGKLGGQLVGVDLQQIADEAIKSRQYLLSKAKMA